MIELVERHKAELRELCRKHGVKRLELFGSALDAGRFRLGSSDLDFLVEFVKMKPVEHAKSYFGLLEDLQDLFAGKIDLVEVRAVTNPYLLESINESRSEIYAA